MSSREEQKRLAREARQTAERAARTGAHRQRILLGAGLATVLIVAVTVGILVLSGSSESQRAAGIEAAPIPAQRVTDLDEAVKLARAKLISHDYSFGINEHVSTPVRYPMNPPTNGPHHPRWTEDGSYAGQPAPPTEQVVHAQEHGRVVIQYRPGLPKRQIQQLVSLYEEAPQHVLLVENATAMPCDVAATAWGKGVLCRKLTAQSFDALRAFRDKYRDKGPETVL